jgi:hypothetical protein
MRDVYDFMRFLFQPWNCKKLKGKARGRKIEAVLNLFTSVVELQQGAKGAGSWKLLDNL